MRYYVYLLCFQLRVMIFIIESYIFTFACIKWYLSQFSHNFGYLKNSYSSNWNILIFFENITRFIWSVTLWCCRFLYSFKKSGSGHSMLHIYSFFFCFSVGKSHSYKFWISGHWGKVLVQSAHADVTDFLKMDKKDASVYRYWHFYWIMVHYIPIIG